MAKDFSPREALQYYRAFNPPHVVSAFEEIKQWPIDEKLELIFYLAIHSSAAISQVTGLSLADNVAENKNDS